MSLSGIFRIGVWAAGCCLAVVFAANGYGKTGGETVAATGDRYPGVTAIQELYPPGDPRREAACYLAANMAGKHARVDRGVLKSLFEQYDSLHRSRRQELSAPDRHLLARQVNPESGGSVETVYDIDIIHPDSVRRSIDHSFGVWAKAPWRNAYSRSCFLEYVLPYRVANEPLEYYWKEDCHENHHPRIAGVEDVAKAAVKINSLIQMEGSPMYYAAPLQSYSSVKSTQTGKCSDRAILVTMALRAVGIPAAYELVPCWGNGNNGHAIASAILPDGSELSFNGPDMVGKLSVNYKTPKIYRKTYSIQRDTPLFAAKGSEAIPPVFSEFDLLDVTDRHADTRDLTVAVENGDNPDNRLVYLAVFAPHHWAPVAYAGRRDGIAVFPHVGTGLDRDGNLTVFCEDMREGILYLPAFCDGGKMVAAGHAVIHDPERTRQLIPRTDSLRTVMITRKYPRAMRIVDFAKRMRGGIFEAARSPDFKDAVELHYVFDTPLSRVQRIPVDTGGTYQYVRFRKPRDHFSLAEFRVNDRNGDPIPGRLIACPAFETAADARNICDGDPLTYFAAEGMIDAWIGFGFDVPAQIGSIEFCPRTDDNEISPGDLYELFYWDRQWISLGRRVADDYRLSYENTPANALFWLRNLTRGVEERPFTYEDGRQIWW